MRLKYDYNVLIIMYDYKCCYVNSAFYTQNYDYEEMF